MSILLPKRRHSVSCRRHVATRRWSCRRRKKMSCRLESLNDTTFDADTPHVEDVAVMKMKDSLGLGLAATTPSQNVQDSVGGGTTKRYQKLLCNGF